MFEVSGNNIYITRGDSGYVEIGIMVQVDDQDPEPYVPLPSDIVSCQVRRAPNGGELIFEGDISVDNEGVITWHIHPENTQHLTVGKYYYDVQIETQDDVYTFIKKSLFKIEDEVTQHGY